MLKKIFSTRGQAIVEFTLSLIPFILLIGFIVGVVLTLGFIAITYYTLQKTAYEIVTDAKVARALILIKGKQDASALIRDAVNQALQANNAFVEVFFGNIFLNHLFFSHGSEPEVVLDEDGEKRHIYNTSKTWIVVLLPSMLQYPTYGFDDEPSSNSTPLTYDQFVPVIGNPQDGYLCQTATTAMSCPVVTLARFNFGKLFGLDLSFNLYAHADLHLGQLNPGSQLVTPRIFNQTPDTDQGNTGNGTTNQILRTPPPPPTPEPCPIRGITSGSNSVSCRDVIGGAFNHLRPTLVQTISSLCGSEAAQVCNDGSCKCGSNSG